MTRSANPYIYACAACSGVMHRSRRMSVSAFGATYYSDGVCSASWALNDALVVCPHCRALSWAEDAQPLGTMLYEPQRKPPQQGWWRKLRWRRDQAAQREWEAWLAMPAAWRAAPREGRPEYADLLRALDVAGGLPPAREIWVRKQLWHKANNVQRWRDEDPVREAARTVPPDAARANMQRLLELLGTGGDTLLLRAELLRNLGRFEEAIRLLKAGAVGGAAAWLAAQIERAARQGNAALLVFEDEE